MMRIPLLLLCQLFLSIVTFGQVTVSEFIKSALEDPEVRTFNEQKRFLEQRTYRLPYLQRLELRTQNRELLANQQEYAIRVTPANPWEVRNNNRYFREYRSSLGLESEFILKTALQARYVRVIEYIYLTELVTFKANLVKSISDQIAVLQKQMGSSFFDADEYVDLQLKKLDEETELDEINLLLADEKFSIARVYQPAFNKRMDWSATQVVSPEQMKRVVDSLDSRAIQSRLIAYQQQKIRLAEQEYALEKANINIGFLQAEFDNRRVEQNRTPFNVSGGITIPIFNPNKGDMAKRKLDMIDATFDLEEAQSEDKVDKMILHERVNFFFQRFLNLQNKISALRNDNVVSTLQTLKGGDPVVRLKFDQSIVKLEMAANKIRRDMLFAYVEYLFIGDFIQRQPLVNLLSPRFEEL
ncbi:MAG TPA: hypothetical protein VGD65_17970 [Chryseosolibacter sp.]